jgi:3D (Asp-Asp-Asp) domain-containing protein/peptidoglycan hydrolase CwlO-like protein
VRQRARYLVPCTAIVLLGCATQTSAGAPGPADRLATLTRAQRSAELELYAADSAVARARASAVELERRRQALDARLERTRRHVAVVRSSLDATNQRVANLLRRLYVEGDADPIAVLLGARSLPGMLAGLDELERTTHANRGIAAELRARSRMLRAQLVRLAQVRRQLTDAERRAKAAVAASERAAASRRATVARIGRRAGVTRARLAAVEARVRAARRASTRIERKSVPAPAPRVEAPGAAATPSPVAPGTRALVVDAVAYHLPGRTASGLPVGVGVIAVDPTVIPLGTRVFVPGYGAAVAADVGSAIKGNIIDLWMPSTAAARAWGRRTVTITVYG